MSAYSESNVRGKRLVEAKLRLLADIPIPDSLEERLVATIPAAQARGSCKRRPSFGWWRFTAGAAAVLLIGLVCVQYCGLSPLCRRPMVVSSNTGQRLGSSDQNGISVTDTNDANSPR